MAIWKKPDIKIDQLNHLCKGIMLDHLGIEITELGEDFIKGTMPVDHRTVQPHGILHGGASCVLAESLGSIAANLCLPDGKSVAVGSSINASHLRPVSAGKVEGIATPLHLGKTSQVWNIHITDNRQKLVCVSRLSMAVVKGS